MTEINTPEWTEWGLWQECSHTCGDGIRFVKINAKMF